MTYLAQGLAADARSYAVGAHILRELGVGRVRLLTNNPAKCAALTTDRLEVLARVGLSTNATTDNVRYLRTKRDRMGHVLDIPDVTDSERSVL
ncbi:hypothetical protein ACFVJ3_15895 [Rhodococcus sp. NPDC127593]|uniref:hypothetical protein n=1 Tax=Rhodococcus sp. NPDC127593 TaxID=3345404 RepID=UPI0036313C4C